MSEALRRRAIRGMLTVGLRTVVVRLLGFAGTLFLARLLEPSQYGVLALGLTIVVLSKFLSDGGLAPGLIRREAPPTREELAAVLALQLGVGLIVLAAVAVGAQLRLADPGQALALTLFALVPVLDAPRTATVITVERDLAFGVVVRGEIAEVLVFNVLAVGLVAAGADLVGVGAAAAAKSVVGTTLIVRAGPVGAIAPRPSWRLLRPLLRFGAAFQGAWLLTLVRDEGLNLLLAGAAGTAALGAWALARRLLVVVTLLVETAWRVALPGMARLLESGEEPRSLLRRSLSLAAVASGVPVVLLVGTTPALVPALFGPGWEDAVRALPLLAGGLVLAVPLGLSLNSLLWAQDEAAKALRIGIAPVALTLAVAAPLLPAHGAVGAGIGWLAGCVAFVGAAAWHARGLFGAAAVAALLGPATAAAAASCAGWALARSIDPPAAAVAVAAAAGMAIYLAALAIVDRQSLVRFTRLARRALPSSPEAAYVRG